MKKYILCFTFFSLSHICFAQTDISKEVQLATTNKQVVSSNNWYGKFTDWLDKQPLISKQKTMKRQKEKTNNHHYTMQIVRPELGKYPILIKSVDTTKNYAIRNLYVPEGSSQR